ncbi:MAG: ATP-dependent chaperone ClpB, partial [Planctomycetes bacterium]|nr:ATP-dependent chaperone ClpB [Planctomycetota bacterium]
MRPDKLTTVAQQVLADAQSDALARGNPEVNSLHVLAALLKENGGPAAAILGRCGADAARVAAIVDSELGRQPTTNSGAGQAGRALLEILGKSEAEADAMKDAYVSSEHLLLAVCDAGGPGKDVLSALGGART